MQDPTEMAAPAEARRQMLAETIAQAVVASGMERRVLLRRLGVDAATLDAWVAGGVDLTFEQALVFEEAVELPRGTLGAAGRYFAFDAVPASNEQVVLESWISTDDEAIESLEAAICLGLGVRLRNQLRVESEDDDGSRTSVVEWVLEILQQPPTVGEPLF